MTARHTPTRLPRPRRGGFTLIELLVSITIILILVGLGLAVAKRARDATIRSRTITILKACNTALSEVVGVRGYAPLSNWSENRRVETSGSRGIGGGIWDFTNVAKLSPTALQMLQNLGPGIYVPSGAGGPSIVDEWGTQLRYFGPEALSKIPGNSSWCVTPGKADDNGIPMVGMIFPLNNGQPYFMSAGPDGRFGDDYRSTRGGGYGGMGYALPDGYTVDMLKAEEKDNIYSFKLE